MAEQRSYLNTAKNALSILKSFTVDEPEQTVKNLSEKLALNKSVASRLLSTLVQEGFVFKIPGTQRFRLGTSVLSLSGVLTSTLDLYKEAEPILEQLVELSRETAHLAVLENLHTVYLSKVNCEHVVQTMTHIGRSNPLHCTSSGKVLIAHADEQKIMEFVGRGLKACTHHSITEPEAFLSHLQKVREDGYAIDIEEHAPGVASVSAPVRDYTQGVVAAINIVGPIQRVNRQTIPSIVKHVTNAAATLSSHMGYIPRRRKQ